MVDIRRLIKVGFAFHWLEGRDGKRESGISSLLKDIGSMYDSDNVTI
jgi:hypothetical protein